MQWFKHESNANTDDKLQNVLLDYGLEGYGLYWYCLELIVNRVDKDNITFELKHDARIIARNTGCSVQKVEEMMKRFVELGLFESSEGAITCIKLLKRMDSSMTSNAFMRDLIINAKKHHDAIMTKSVNVMQDKNRIDKKRIEENREEKTIKPLRENKSAPQKNEDTELQLTCRQIWKSYSDSYFDRYGVEPIRNTKVNSIIKQYAQRLPKEDSPLVASHYVQSNNSFYVGRGHSVDMLLKDCEKLRTEWATNTSITNTRAKQIDKTQTNGNVVAEAMKILEARNAKHN